MARRSQICSHVVTKLLNMSISAAVHRPHVTAVVWTRCITPNEFGLVINASSA